MTNPFEVFFGTLPVRLLQDRPGSLKRIAGVVAPLMLARVHPDTSLAPDDDAETAKEITEAKQAFIEGTRLAEFAEEFFVRRSKDNQWREEAVRLKRELASRDRMLAELRERHERDTTDALIETHRAYQFAWWWFLSACVSQPPEARPRSFAEPGHPNLLFQGLPLGAIPLMLLYRFEFVAEDHPWRHKFGASLTGEVTHRVRTNLETGDWYGEEMCVPGRIVGSIEDPGATSALSGVTWGEAFRAGLIRPYLEVGSWVLVLQRTTDAFASDTPIRGCRLEGRLTHAQELAPTRGATPNAAPFPQLNGR